MTEKYTIIRRILWIILGINWSISAAKITIGSVIGSISMIADGIHSLADGVSNIIGLIATAIAGKPADDSHPYGHHKFETLASLAIAGLLLMASVNIVTEGGRRLFNPQIPQVSWESISLVGVTILINWGVMYYEYSRGKKLQSDVLVADAMHTRSDIIVSVAVLVTLLGSKYGMPWVDPIASLGIALFIAWAAWDIIKHCADILCDGTALPVEEVQRIVAEVDGVLGCHRIRSRGRVDYLFVDLHILVSKDCSLLQAHLISHDVESAIKKVFRGVGDVVVHIEPFIEAELRLRKRRWF